MLKYPPFEKEKKTVEWETFKEVAIFCTHLTMSTDYIQVSLKPFKNKKKVLKKSNLGMAQSILNKFKKILNNGMRLILYTIFVYNFIDLQ